MRAFLVNLLRAVTYQVLGAALLTPGAVALAVLILREFTPGRLFVLWLCCLPVSLALAAIPVVQRVELAAAEELLRVVVPARPDRVGVSVLAACHLFTGATTSALAAVTIPGIAYSFAASWRNQPGKPILGFVTLGAVLVAMWVCAGAQRWIASRLLKAGLHSEIDRLNRRQRLAAELHDSVGHALSVVLVQAMAAQEVAESAPAGAGWSAPIRQLVDTARDAQQQLDDLLGVLDEEVERRGPTLTEVARLVTGLAVDYRHDAVDGVAPDISRVAFALAREAVTNAVRHGEAPVRLRITVRDELVVSTVNRLRPGEDAHGGGRGLAGMRTRAALAGGTCSWWEEDGQWHTRAALPLRAG
jgi:signal transduction histidine kinase